MASEFTFLGTRDGASDIMFYGFPFVPEDIDVSGFDFYQTLGGTQKGATPTDAEIELSHDNAVKLYWNIYGMTYTNVFGTYSGDVDQGSDYSSGQPESSLRDLPTDVLGSDLYGVDWIDFGATGFNGFNFLGETGSIIRMFNGSTFLGFGVKSSTGFSSAIQAGFQVFWQGALNGSLYGSYFNNGILDFGATSLSYETISGIPMVRATNDSATTLDSIEFASYV